MHVYMQSYTIHEGMHVYMHAYMHTCKMHANIHTYINGCKTTIKVSHQFYTRHRKRCEMLVTLRCPAKDDIMVPSIATRKWMNIMRRSAGFPCCIQAPPRYIND